MSTRLLRSAGIAAAALVAAPLAVGQTVVSEGDVPTYEFRDAPTNGLGAKSLEDLRGRPVLVESQGATPDAADAFALGYKWLGGKAMWTTEAPFSTGQGTLPSAVLLSASGQVLLKGNPMDLHGQMKELIPEQIKLAKSGPPDAPSALKKAWKEYGKGAYAKAIGEARTVEAKGGDDAAPAGELARAFAARVARSIDQAQWMLDNGHPLEARERLQKLAKALAGEDELAARVDELQARLSSEELTRELAAADELAKIEKKLFGKKGGPDEKIAKALRDLAESHAGTKVAKRAERLARLVSAA